MLVNTIKAMNPDSSEDGEIPAETFSVTVTDATFSVEISSASVERSLSRGARMEISVCSLYGQC